MDSDRNTALRHGLRQPQNMSVTAMDAAGGDQGHQMRRPTIGLEVSAKRIELRQLAHAAIGHRRVNPRKVLMDDAPRADRHMPHFGIAHLTFGEAHRRARGQ